MYHNSVKLLRSSETYHGLKVPGCLLVTHTHLNLNPSMLAPHDVNLGAALKAACAAALAEIMTAISSAAIPKELPGNPVSNLKEFMIMKGCHAHASCT